MPKRAAVPEGKALFYRSADAPADPAITEQPASRTSGADAGSDVASTPTQPSLDPVPAPAQPAPQPVAPPSPQTEDTPSTQPSQRHTTRQSAIFLEEYHLDWLDDRCREARRNGGRAIRKAAVIRALLDVAMEASINLTTLHSEDEIKPRIRAALRS